MTAWQPRWLPPYVSNGIVGMRLDRAPFGQGTTIVNGFVGSDPADGTEGFGPAPFALAADVEIAGLRVSAAPDRLQFVSQDYSFENGELTTRWHFQHAGVRADIESVVFASRSIPSIVLQRLTLRLDAPATIAIVAGLDRTSVPGELADPEQPPKGGPIEGVDGRATWISNGALSRLGMAYATRLDGAPDPRRTTSPYDQRGIFGTTYRFDARNGTAYRLTQLTALVPELAHHDPAKQAGRLVALAVEQEWDGLRAANQAIWADIWKGRIEVEGADPRWQAITDASLFYLRTSVHAASLASTSLFGLAWWPDYHYYHGHVMWDLETFVVPPLTLLDPEAARAILAYRLRHLDAARRNAALVGRRGALFPWESGPLHGEEATPGSRPTLQDHATLDVALAVADHVAVTGDSDLARTMAWPIVRAVAEYVESRVSPMSGSYRWLSTIGPREDYTPVDDNAYVNMAAARTLVVASELAAFIGEEAHPAWSRIAQTLRLPLGSRWIKNHSAGSLRDRKGGTPEAAAGLLLTGYKVAPALERATYGYAVERQAPRYVGTPMFSALLAGFASRIGDSAATLDLLERGYGAFVNEPYSEVDEFPTMTDRPRASPMFANLGGYLTTLLRGFARISPSMGQPETWCEGPIVLPAGWRAVRAERLWIRGRAVALEARAGESRATTDPDSD